MEQKVQRFPIYHLPQTCIASPIINILHYSGAFVVVDEPKIHPKIPDILVYYFLFNIFLGYFLERLFPFSIKYML